MRLREKMMTRIENPGNDDRGTHGKPNLYRMYVRRLTFDMQLHVVRGRYLFKLKSFIVFGIAIVLLLGALMLAQGLVKDPVVLFQLELDVWITLADAVFVTKVGNLDEYHSQNTHYC